LFSIKSMAFCGFSISRLSKSSKLFLAQSADGGGKPSIGEIIAIHLFVIFHSCNSSFNKSKRFGCTGATVGANAIIIKRNKFSAAVGANSTGVI